MLTRLQKSLLKTNNSQTNVIVLNSTLNNKKKINTKNSNKRNINELNRVTNEDWKECKKRLIQFSHNQLQFICQQLLTTIEAKCDTNELQLLSSNIIKQIS